MGSPGSRITKPLEQFMINRSNTEFFNLNIYIAKLPFTATFTHPKNGLYFTQIKIRKSIF